MAVWWMVGFFLAGRAPLVGFSRFSLRSLSASCSLSVSSGSPFVSCYACLFLFRCVFFRFFLVGVRRVQVVRRARRLVLQNPCILRRSALQIPSSTRKWDTFFL